MSENVNNWVVPSSKVLLGVACGAVGVGLCCYYFHARQSYDIEALKRKGRQHFAECTFSEAIKCYTRAIELCSDDTITLSTLHLYRAAVHEELEDWPKVVEDCTCAIGMNPNYLKALYCRAKAYSNMGEKRDGLEDVTLLLLLNGFKNKHFMKLAGKIAKDIGKELAAVEFAKRVVELPSSNHIKGYFSSFTGDVFGTQGNYIVSCEGDVVYEDILCKLKSHEYNGIVEMCDAVINSDSPHRHRALLLRATFNSLLDRDDRAEKDLNELIETVDGNWDTSFRVHSLIKRVGVKMHRFDDQGCLDDFERALQIDDRNANIYHSRGQLHFYAGRRNEAMTDFKKAIELDPSFVAPRIHLGHCISYLAKHAQSSGDDDWVHMQREANNVLEETVRLFPENYNALSMYGQMLHDQGRYYEAVTKFELALALSPTSATIYVHKALLIMEWRKDITQAVQLIRKAIELDDKCDIAYVTLASLEAQRGDDEEAIRLWRHSLLFVRSETEMGYTFGLIEAAEFRLKVSDKYDVPRKAVPRELVSESPSTWAVAPVA